MDRLDQLGPVCNLLQLAGSLARFALWLRDKRRCSRERSPRLAPKQATGGHSGAHATGLQATGTWQGTGRHGRVTRPGHPGAIQQWEQSVEDASVGTLSPVPVVVFLRGMNLGKRRLANDALVAVFEGAGFTSVSAYQASGNVILGDDDTADEATISRLLADQLGYDVPVFVRTAAALTAIASASPISGKTGADGGKPQIVFLHDPPDTDPSDLLGPDHEVHAIGTELHWLPPGGLADLGSVLKAMDTAFGGTTVRTLGTIERLVKRLT